MALFRLKKDKEKEASKKVEVSEVKKSKSSKDVSSVGKKVDKRPVKKSTSVATSLNYKKDTASVLKNPRVTEKATTMSENGVYVFDVAPRATKVEVAEAIKSLYKVTPRKINMVKVPSKRVRMRGRQNKFGVKSGGKKAYVYVKKGDTIDIV